MRLDARNGPPDSGYHVYHAEEMRLLSLVVWADSDSAQYGQYKHTSLGPVTAVYDEIVTHQAKRIDIVASARLVVINPIADDNDQYIQKVEVVSRDKTEPVCT